MGASQLPEGLARLMRFLVARLGLAARISSVVVFPCSVQIANAVQFSDSRVSASTAAVAQRAMVERVSRRRFLLSSNGCFFDVPRYKPAEQRAARFGEPHLTRVHPRPTPAAEAPLRQSAFSRTWAEKFYCHFRRPSTIMPSED